MITSRPGTPLAGELAPVWSPNRVPQHYLRRYSAATCGVASHRLQRSGIATRFGSFLGCRPRPSWLWAEKGRARLGRFLRRLWLFGLTTPSTATFSQDHSPSIAHAAYLR